MKEFNLIPKNVGKMNKVIIKCDWDDGDYITETYHYEDSDLPTFVLLREVFENRNEIESVDGRRYALNIRVDFHKYFERFVKLKVENDKLRNKLFSLYVDDISDILYRLIPFKSSSGYGYHSVDITIVKNGVEYEFSHDFSIDELFKKLI